MAIPDFQTIMRPLLSLFDDGDDHAVGDCRATLADQFGLTAQDLEQRLPSGRAFLFQNRVGWATNYLLNAKMLERVGRGVYRITDTGRDALEAHPDRIDVSVLKSVPEFAEFHSSSRRRGGTIEDASSLEDVATTPDERIQTAYSEHRQALVQTVLDRISTTDPEFFERLVLDVLVGMGYGGNLAEASEHLGRTNDGGVDGVIQEDRLGLDSIYVQAKQWANPVGRPEIQKFVGALEGQQASKGVFITSSRFSPEAELYAKGVRSRVILIDGLRLASLMVDYDVGVAEVERYLLKKIDTDYFGADQE